MVFGKKKATKKKPLVRTVEPSDDHNSVIESIIQEIDAKYGKGTIARLSDAKGAVLHKWSTGSVALDIALRGGLVCNKCVTYWGKRSTGKTALATISGVTHIDQAFVTPPWAEDERDSLVRLCIFLDLEDSFDPEWAQILGADPSRFILVKVSHGEKAWDVVCDLVERPDTSIHIIVDSVKAIISLADMEMTANDKTTPASHARVVTKGLRKLWPRLKGDLLSDRPRHNVLFLNQSTMEIGKLFGDPEKLTGGLMYEHVQMQIIKFSRAGDIKTVKSDSKTENVGFQIAFKVQKEKAGGMEGYSGRMTFYRRRVPSLGIVAGSVDNAADILSPAVDMGIISKSGKTFKYSGITLSTNGELTAAKTIRKDGELFQAIRMDIFNELQRERALMVEERAKFVRNERDSWEGEDDGVEDLSFEPDPEDDDEETLLNT